MSLFESEKEKFSSIWWSFLGHHFKEQYMQDIYDKVKGWAESGDLIFPARKDLFTQFKKCNYSDVIICFVTKDLIINYIQSPLYQNISRWIEEECYKGLNLNLEDNMNYLLKQGVFNLPMTRTWSKENDHSKLGWERFLLEALKYLNKSLNKILFVCEESCMGYMSPIDTGWHKVIKLEQGCFKEILDFAAKEYNVDLKF